MRFFAFASGENSTLQTEVALQDANLKLDEQNTLGLRLNQLAQTGDDGAARFVASMAFGCLNLPENTAINFFTYLVCPLIFIFSVFPLATPINKYTSLKTEIH